jgi:hypothetical protein
MKYFYDCEFLEDGKTIDLISIGMVCEDGREFYAVSNQFDTNRVMKDVWLMANVMSSIDHVVIGVDEYETPISLLVTDVNAFPRSVIRDKLVEFIGNDPFPQFWAWYGAYDHVAYAQLFGKMIDLPKNFPMFTCDIKQKAVEMGSPTMPRQSEGLHNALDDARQNMVRYEFLEALAQRRANEDANNN